MGGESIDASSISLQVHGLLGDLRRWVPALQGVAGLGQQDPGVVGRKAGGKVAGSGAAGGGSPRR